MPISIAVYNAFHYLWYCKVDVIHTKYENSNYWPEKIHIKSINEMIFLKLFTVFKYTMKTQKNNFIKTFR